MNGPRFISQERYKRTQRINWNNPHTKRLQQIVGDDKLYVGFDNKAQRWVIARLCRRYIVERWGKRELTSEVQVPVIWKTWEEGAGGKALHPSHPELPGYLMRCDRWRRAKDLDQYDVMTHTMQRWRRESRARERRETGKELFLPFQKMADSLVGTVSAKGDGSDSFSFMSNAYHKRAMNNASQLSSAH